MASAPSASAPLASAPLLVEEEDEEEEEEEADPDLLHKLLGHFSAPCPASVPIPGFVGPRVQPPVPSFAPEAASLPLPFLTHSHLSSFVVGQLRFLEQPLGDADGYRATVRFLRNFERWCIWSRWHLL